MASAELKIGEDVWRGTLEKVVTPPPPPPPPPAPTATLSVQPASATAGAQVRLTWATANATTATIDNQPVPLSGTRLDTASATKTYTLVARATDGRTATATAALTVTPVTPPPATGKRVLRQADFEYQGAFAYPTGTEWAPTGIGCRRVGGQLRFFLVAAEQYNVIYEVNHPGLSRAPGPWPEAAPITIWNWGQLYGAEGRNLKKPPEMAVGNAVQGLHWDETRKRLYYTYGDGYNVNGTNDPSLGYVDFGATTPKPAPVGPWRDLNNGVHSQQIRGGACAIPEAFAQQHLGGRSLGVGFGGYYSGIAQCSKGPHLSAAFHPGAGEDLDLKVLIHHPDEHWGRRNPDYDNRINWTPNPTGSGPLDGFWTAADTCHGLWIDLPDAHGYLVFSTLAHGAVYYREGIGQEHQKQWWWSYDPASLAEVAAGRKKPWEHSPAVWEMAYSPQDGEGVLPIHTQGACFDAPSRTIYVPAPFASNRGGQWGTLVHAWKVREV